jgi:Abnormal spindle-like microcephaly-assoc'd, ASPM-SPD-2-Hydin
MKATTEAVRLKRLRHYFYRVCSVAVLLTGGGNILAQSAPPTISSLSPGSIAAGGPGFILTVNGAVTGTGFISGDTVRWNGANRPTTFVSSTQLTASIPATDLQDSGIQIITVASSSNGISAGVGFPVLPAIFSLNPSSAIVGGPSFLLTVNGAGFVSDGGSRILWNGAVLTTNFISSTQLTTTVSASLIATTGSAAITALNNFEQLASAPVAFPIVNPVPSTSSVSPASVVAGSGALTLTVNGVNFVAGASVRLNGVSYSTTFVSSTQLTASIPASVVGSVTTVSVTVVNPAPGGGASNSVTFAVVAPQITVSPGTLDFGDVRVGTSAARDVTVSNPESVPVSVSASTSFGSPYTIAPSAFTLSPNGSRVVTVTFTPTAAALYDALASFLATGTERLVGLTGRGTLVSFTFNYSVSGQTAVPVLPGGTISLPAVNVDGSSGVQFQIVNAGSSPATINSISSNRPVFPLSGLPAFPVTLPASGSVSFTVGFVPTAPGSSTGSLTVNNSSFVLTGTATVSPLTYRYILTGGSPVNLSPGGTIPLPAVAAGGTSSAQFQIVNSATNLASVTTITSSSSLFTLGNLPALPATVPAGGSLDLNLTFRPTAAGAATGTLTVGTRTFSLSGTGLAPGVNLSGLTDVVTPAQQPRVGVDLTAATAVPLTGQLVLTFTPSADVPSDDPAVQFATGGRSVSFTVPANGTKSDFSGSPDIAFSTGTVAGTLRLVVTLRNGSTDVTPTSPDPNRTVTVERRAPAITSVSVASRTTSGFEIVIVGYSTPRSLSQAVFRFSPRAGSNVQGGDVTVNVTNQFTAWYQGTDSQPFGSQFRLRIPFTVQGDVNAIGSVSVTLGNAVGTSAASSATF